MGKREEGDYYQSLPVLKSQTHTRNVHSNNDLLDIPQTVSEVHRLQKSAMVFLIIIKNIVKSKDKEYLINFLRTVTSC